MGFSHGSSSSNGGPPAQAATVVSLHLPCPPGFRYVAERSDHFVALLWPEMEVGQKMHAFFSLEAAA